MKQIDLKIDGMVCGACVRRVAGALSALPGVQVESVIAGQARVLIDADETTATRVVEAIESVGYTVTKG